MSVIVHTLTETKFGLGSVLEPNGGAGTRILVTFHAMRSGGNAPPELVTLPTLWLEPETARQIAEVLLSRAGGPGDGESLEAPPPSFQ